MTDAQKPEPDSAKIVPPNKVRDAKNSSGDGVKSDAPLESEPAKAKGHRGFFPALTGAIFGAILGVLAATSGVLDVLLPDTFKSPDPTDAITELQTTVGDQAKAMATLNATLDSINMPDIAPLTAQLTALNDRIASLVAQSETQAAHLRDIETRLDPLQTRLEELEMRPMREGASDEAVAAYDREMDALRDAVAAQRGEVEQMIGEAQAAEAAALALKDQAASESRLAANRAIVARLQAAVNDGVAYGVITSDLVSAGVVVPDVLAASAQDGVTSLGALGDAFPIAARNALAAARAETGDTGGIGGFLQRQLGARSVQPRDGDDPDAILSRAEAALTGGDLSTALAEIATLPDVARAPMQDWVALAQTRQTALTAVTDLADSLNTN